ncbi:alkane 1-monooxygenase [Hydrocarboniphaga sp.]|uniref:alkane 1-monooxygenase n=1 Tax=Hydrocarboniphaga sp. TaxID=2033016 RepID=UPI003D0ADA1C
MANLARHLKYSSMTLVGLSFTILLALGDAYMVAAFAFWILVAVGGDFAFGRDLDEPEYTATWLLDFFLFMSLPVLIGMTVVFAWYLGDGDPLGLGAFVLAHTGYDMVAAKAATSIVELAFGFAAMGLAYVLIGTNVGHELTHRTWSPAAQLVGRWMLAFSFDTAFSIEHVYGHHRNIATREDPASARRGKNVYKFMFTSTLGQFYHGFKLEKERLARQGLSAFTWKNRAARGQLMTLTIFAFFGYMAGWTGVAVFFLLAVYTKFYLEVVNYVEHYGIARVPGEPVEPRHSWNCNQTMSTWILYNLPRHSHHHAKGEDPFWELRAYPQAPMLPFGYMTMILVALVPPLYRKVMTPKVLDWDRRFSVPAEWPLIEQQNRESGDPVYTRSTAHRESPGKVRSYGTGNAGVVGLSNG